MLKHDTPARDKTMQSYNPCSNCCKTRPMHLSNTHVLHCYSTYVLHYWNHYHDRHPARTCHSQPEPACVWPANCCCHSRQHKLSTHTHHVHLRSLRPTAEHTAHRSLLSHSTVAQTTGQHPACLLLCRTREPHANLPAGQLPPETECVTLVRHSRWAHDSVRRHPICHLVDNLCPSPPSVQQRVEMHMQAHTGQVGGKLTKAAMYNHTAACCILQAKQKVKLLHKPAGNKSYGKLKTSSPAEHVQVRSSAGGRSGSRGQHMPLLCHVHSHQAPRLPRHVSTHRITLKARRCCSECQSSCA
jgi:hypothetical protein